MAQGPGQVTNGLFSPSEYVKRPCTDNRLMRDLMPLVSECRETERDIRNTARIHLRVWLSTSGDVNQMTGNPTPPPRLVTKRV